jgi:Protein of unknown function (DUF1566)
MSQSTTPPIHLIGQHWPEQGGIFKGIMANGGKPYALIEASPEHDIKDVAWGGYGKKIEGADSYHDGAANTAAMAAAGLEIAQRVNALQIEGHNDWYIPAIGEMHLAIAHKQPDGEGWYWSSAQCSASGAWVQSFDYGDTSLGSKSGSSHVRPVRRLFL